MSLPQHDRIARLPGSGWWVYPAMAVLAVAWAALGHGGRQLELL